MKYIQNSHTLNDFNKIIKIYILFKFIFIWSPFFIAAFFFPILIYLFIYLFFFAWICSQNFSVLLTFFALFLIIYASFPTIIDFKCVKIYIFYIGKFSIFIWKTWKSQGIFKFIFCSNPVNVLFIIMNINIYLSPFFFYLFKHKCIIYQCLIPNHEQQVMMVKYFTI